jgi:hypothetical protein
VRRGPALVDGFTPSRRPTIGEGGSPFEPGRGGLDLGVRVRAAMRPELPVCCWHWLRRHVCQSVFWRRRRNVPTTQLTSLYAPLMRAAVAMVRMSLSLSLTVVAGAGVATAARQMENAVPIGIPKDLQLSSEAQNDGEVCVSSAALSRESTSVRAADRHSATGFGLPPA